MLADSHGNHSCSTKIITLKIYTVLVKSGKLDANFAITFVIAIHLTCFQSYHGVQVQLNPYSLLEEGQEILASYPAPPELNNLVAWAARVKTLNWTIWNIHSRYFTVSLDVAAWHIFSVVWVFLLLVEAFGIPIRKYYLYQRVLSWIKTINPGNGLCSVPYVSVCLFWIWVWIIWMLLWGQWSMTSLEWHTRLWYLCWFIIPHEAWTWHFLP